MLMIFAEGGAKDLFTAFLIVSAIGVFTMSALRLAGWSWWSRTIIVIPIVAVAARMAVRLLHNTIIFF